MRRIPTSALLSELDPLEVIGTLPPLVIGVTQDSRLVEDGFVFAARSGGKAAGLNFIQDAVARGAVLLLTAEELPSGLVIPAVRVAAFRPALVKAARIIYDDPSRRLNLVGVSGTNGKSSTVHLFRSIIEAAGEKCAMLSTVGYWTGRRHFEANLTTPDIDRISGLLSEAAGSDCRWGVMEVSSQALEQGRVRGLRFAAAGFSNLTVDHLDYHLTLERYADAKAMLFRGLPPGGVAAVNINGPWGVKMARAAWGSLVTVGGPDTGADCQVTALDHSVAGARYRLEWLGRPFEVRTTLVGAYQGENIALAAALALSLEVDPDSVARGVESLRAVPGRMESVARGQPFALFVDYAHTPDALQRALNSLRSLTSGRLIVLFGCGGDRDRSKRPQMGRIASLAADIVVITSDNPRTEDPAAIIAEIAAGISPDLRGKVSREVDRREATHYAVRIAEPGDVLLIAGKGSETYFEVDGVRRPYDDRLVAVEALQEAGFAASEGGLRR